MRPFHRTSRSASARSEVDDAVATAAPAVGVHAPGRQYVVGQVVPISLAVGAYGLSYGVLATAAGLSPALATLSSVVVLAGGSQFAFVGVLAAGGHPLTGALGGLLLNLRYLAFGLAIAPHLERGPWWRRALDSYLLVDESVALALGGRRERRARRRSGSDGVDTAADGRDATDTAAARPELTVAGRYRRVGLGVVIAWIGATAIGAYGGQFLGDPERFGLDAAFPAGFLALLAPWLRHRAGRVAAAVGVLLALVLTPITPPGIPILAAGLGAVVAMQVPRNGPVRRDRPASENRPVPRDRPASPKETP